MYFLANCTSERWRVSNTGELTEIKLPISNVTQVYNDIDEEDNDVIYVITG